MEVSGLLHVQAVLPAGKCPQYPLSMRLCWPQNRSERDGKVKILKNSVPSVIHPVATRSTVCTIPTLIPAVVNNL